MKLNDVCAALGIDRDELLRLVWSGEMPALHIGCWFIIRPRDLEEYIAQRLPAEAS